ncbi:MAG: sugar ABC transporter permease [Spirochaetales bacterium]|nr:sugar ABC transporter permease [Spirochaetales bacterium]
MDIASADINRSETTVSQLVLDQNRRRRRLKESVEGYLFIAPSVLLISLFGIFPLFFTIYISAHRWRLRKGELIGLSNFAELSGGLLWPLVLVAGIAALVTAGILLGKVRERARAQRVGGAAPNTAPRILGWIIVAVGIAAIAIALPQIWDLGDDDMLKSLRITIWYAVGTVPIQLAFGLLLAVLLDQRFKGRQFFRVIFLLPYIVPTVASAAIFQVLFSLRPESFANQLIAVFGASPLEWLGERDGVFMMFFNWGAGDAVTTIGEYWQGWLQGPSLALVSVMIFNYWVYIGYYALIYSNGLANIPRQLYEAAEVDGASKRTVLWKIIVPLLSPTTFFLTLLGVIGTFKSFNSLYVLRNPSTGGATDTMSLYIFFTFFRRSRFGYAAAMALVLFALVLGLTFLQRRLMERRIHYGD